MANDSFYLTPPERGEEPVCWCGHPNGLHERDVCDSPGCYCDGYGQREPYEEPGYDAGDDEDF